MNTNIFKCKLLLLNERMESWFKRILKFTYKQPRQKSLAIPILILPVMLGINIRGVIEKFVSFSDTEKRRILNKFCDVHIEIKYVRSN